MAVGTVSGIAPEDNWQLITTNTPSGASSFTFSSISGYKKLMLMFQAYTTSVAGPARLSFNGDTTTDNYFSTADWGTNGIEGSRNWVVLGGYYNYTTQTRSGYLVIENVNESKEHIFKGTASDAFTLDGVYFVTSPITSLTITGPGGTLSGTFKLFGIAA
jgi:hypothetical protein